MLRESIGWHDHNFTEQIRHRMIRRLDGIEIKDTIDATNKQLAQYDLPDSAALQRLPHNVISHSDELQSLNRELKNFLFTKMYRQHRVVRMAKKAERIITQMFETYIDEPAQLPPSVHAAAEERGLHRAVTDYIAGMTDRYAMKEWQRLFDPFTRA